MSIYKQYDIRGIYPEEVNEDIFYNIARAFIIYIKKKRIIVARDARLSSPKLHKSILKGLLDQGVEVTDIGLSTTPMFYFAIKKYNLDAGIMITASHLSKEYNGLKFCKKNAEPISYNNGINHIERIVKIKKFKKVKKGSINQKNVFNDYKKFILKKAVKTDLNVIVDAGNMMGYIDGKILSSICSIRQLFFKPDGNIPNRGIDSSKLENLKKLTEEVIKQKADLGIAFDGDADRISFIDDKGNYVSSYKIACLLMGLIPKNSRLIYDITVSSIVNNEAKKYQLISIISKVGRTNVIESMRKNKAFFGVESSNHYYFKSNYYMDSGVMTALFLIKLLHKEKKKLSELLRQLPGTFYEQITIKDKNIAIENLQNRFIKDAKKISKLDGVSIYHENYWINIRQSNTEDLIKITIESKTREKLNEIKLIINQNLLF